MTDIFKRIYILYILMYCRCTSVLCCEAWIRLFSTFRTEYSVRICRMSIWLPVRANLPSGAAVQWVGDLLSLIPVWFMHYILFLWQDDWFMKYKQNQLVHWQDHAMHRKVDTTFKYHKYLASDSPRDNIILCVHFVYHSDIKSNTTFTCRTVFFFFRTYIAHPASNWIDDYISWLEPSTFGTPCCRYKKINNTKIFCPSTGKLCIHYILHTV